MSEVITVGAPAPELLSRAEDMLALAQSYRIDCIEAREAAAVDLKKIKGLASAVDRQRKDITEPLDSAKRRVMQLFSRPADFLAKAEDVIKRACLDWDETEDRKRRQAELEAARAADAERTRLEAEAAKQKEAGNAEAAQIIREAAEMVAPVPVVNEAPKIAGESHREVWHAEVTDLRALARAVGAGEVPEEYVVGMMSTLNGVARALKGNMRVPGVKAVCVKVLASRAA